jgi:nickel/cobalt transporter (NicO) family protein
MRENGAMRRIALGLTLLLASLSPAAAHPHIWIDHALTIVFRAGEPAALRVRWTFDAMYSALLRAENVQSRGDTLSRDDVEQLRKNAFVNLAGYEYFLVIKFGEERLKVPEATSFDARLSDGRVVYDFVVPIDSAGKAAPLEVAVVDPEWYVAFALSKDEPLRQEGGTAECEVSHAERRGPFDMSGIDTVRCEWRK